MRKCSLLFPSFFWIVQDDTGTGISRTNQCIEQVGLVIDIHKFWSRLDRHRISKHISAETGVLVFNLRYLETVIRVLNATQFQRYRNKEMVIHLDYWFGQPDDERCTRIRETNINALKTLRSDYRSDGSSYLTLIITGSVGEQEVASIRAIDFIRHSTTELLEDCEWAIAIGDKERRNGNLKQAENYYNVSDHFTEIIDIFHEEYGALRFRLVVLHMERSLGIAACFYAAKDYENSSLEASRTSQVACLLMDGRSEEEVNVCTRILYRVGNILRKLGGPQRGHHLREARHTLCMALLYTTDLALEEDVKATMHFAQQDGPSAEDPLPDWIIDLDTDGKLKEAQMY
ncbi:hypothetical protein MMC10_002763 [Thelotrema lepadinum]|nr:hypothetical protein [Thelotrema lepadinum]